MMLAAVDFSVEELAIVSTLLAALTGAVVYLWRQQVESYKEQIVTWKDMATRATTNLQEVAAQRRVANQLEVIPVVAPVVSEHSSPPTQRQKDTAEMATWRAALTAAALELGLPPREEKTE